MGQIEKTKLVLDSPFNEEDLFISLKLQTAN